jgi:hypothetical protein
MPIQSELASIDYTNTKKRWDHIDSLFIYRHIQSPAIRYADPASTSEDVKRNDGDIEQ